MPHIDPRSRRAESDRAGNEQSSLSHLRWSSTAESSPTRAQKLLRLVGLLLGLGLLAYTLRDVDAAQLGRVLSDIGPVCVLLLVPQAVGILLHTAAWKELLSALGSRAGDAGPAPTRQLRGRRASFFALTAVYVEAEAMRMALPAGPAISESFSAWQVKSRFEIPWTRSIAAIAAKKAWVLCSHAACFVLLLIVGHEAFQRLAASVPGGFALGWIAAATALALATAGVATIALLASKRAAAAVTSALSRMPWERVRAWAVDQRKKPEAEAAADIPLASHAAAGLFMFGQWVTEIAETWLILHLVGVPVSVTEAIVVELGGSLVRSLAFVVPGGLGVQDASYVSLLSGLGVAGSGSGVAAFVLLKRTKDLLYVALGLSLFALAKRRAALVPQTLMDIVEAPSVGVVHAAPPLRKPL